LVSFLSDLLRLQHTLPDGFHHIRHYGFLANRHRTDKLARCRELFSVTASAALDWALLGDATQSTTVYRPRVARLATTLLLKYIGYRLAHRIL
jgi:hypothetical protein